MGLYFTAVVLFLLRFPRCVFIFHIMEFRIMLFAFLLSRLLIPHSPFPSPVSPFSLLTPSHFLPFDVSPFTPFTSLILSLSPVWRLSFTPFTSLTLSLSHVWSLSFHSFHFSHFLPFDVSRYTPFTSLTLSLSPVWRLTFHLSHSSHLSHCLSSHRFLISPIPQISPTTSSGCAGRSI